MEDHAVPPHGDCHSIVPVSETVGRDEKALGLWKSPDGKHEEEIDEVAEVSKEIVIALLVVGEEPDGHEICELYGEPVVEASRPGTDEVAADEDVEDGGNE